MIQETLDMALTEEQKAIGLWLTIAPANSNTLNLIYQGSVIDSFNLSAVTMSEIQIVAQKFMRERR